ncbi:MAG TPA: serine/threonine-protein kinase [Planctomycetota bacterium]|nr:serine/threonine-protein kinase [Planctomycetota bacterium]
MEVFDEAKARPAGAERERFLAERCKDEPELKEQVVSLLQAHEGAGDFLKSTTPPPTVPVTEKPGDRIGRYKLLEQIGEGGCGVVYMAEQEEPVRRRVALKVIKLGMDTTQVVARFEAERQALALMDHPNIARVLDGGATDTGRPFFVMELVRGIKITDYCDQNSLSTADRLELFIKVCHSIQHAHQKGIIHRDIKPSNILVTQHDSVAVPKVIDFGIAKATTGHLTDKTLFTAFAQFMGTPAYMSPEQAQMSGLDIDTRTDIYSLGVLFYEMLTGKPPFDPEELFASGLDEIRRIIREQEPPKPSTRLSTLNHADLSTVAAHRHTEPPRLVHLIRGDLDWIVMRCLEKDRGRRYETANDVAMDLRRHLKSEPVLACPPSAAYRFRKFARRNRAALAAALAFGLVVLLTVAGLAISNRLVSREKEEKDVALQRAVEEKGRADRNLSRAREAVKEYLLKTSENPLLQSGDFQGLRKDLLETAIPFYEEFVRQDQQNPDLELERGRAYDDLGFLRQGTGDQERAAADFEEAQGIFRRLAEKFPANPVYLLRLAEGHNSRGGVLKDLGKLDAAEQEFRQALTLVEKLVSEQKGVAEYAASQARIQGNLGLLLRESGRLPEAQSMFLQSVAVREKLLEQEPASMPLRGQLATSWNNLGTLFRVLRQAGEAERAFEKVLEILDSAVVKQRSGGSSEPAKFQHLRAHAWNNVGIMRNEGERFTEAEQAFRQALAIKEKLAETFPSIPQYRHDLAGSLNNLGTLLTSGNKIDEGQAAYQRAIQLYERLVADSPADTRFVVTLAGTYSNMGRLIGDQGQLEPSLPWLTKSVEILEGALRRDQRVAKVRETLCIAYWTRAMTLAGLNRFSEALEDWNRAIDMDDGRYLLALRLKRASNLLQLKDHLRAVADVAAVVESSSVTAEDLYNAACVYALSARLSQDDGPRADSYAGHAVVLLRRALGNGFKDLAHLNSDSDLEGLRSREDFQILIKGLDAGSSGVKGQEKE